MGLIRREWPALWQVDLYDKRLELTADRLRVVREGDGGEVFVARIEEGDIGTVARYLNAVGCCAPFAQDAPQAVGWLERNRTSIGLALACVMFALVLASIVAVLTLGAPIVATVIVGIALIVVPPAAVIFGMAFVVYKVHFAPRRQPVSWWSVV